MLFGLRILYLGMLVITTSLANAGESLKKTVQSRPLLGTVVTVEVCQAGSDAGPVRAAFQSAWQRLDEIHARMNSYDPASDVSLVNKAAGQAVKVHADVVELIRRSQEFRHLTGGVFDVTIAPLSRLWKESAKKDHYPSQPDILATKKLVNAGKIELLPDGRVRLPDPGMQLDLNGDVSGYAADEVVAIFRRAGISSFLIDTGGEIYAAGLNCEGRKWRVGISDPNDPGKMIEVAELSDAAINTSGDYEKYVVIRGRRWSHIINPLTGYPAVGAASVTVIAPTTIEADVLAKPLAILGPDAGFRFFRSFGKGYEALIYWRGEDGKLVRHTTPGYKNYQRRE